MAEEDVSRLAENSENFPLLEEGENQSTKGSRIIGRILPAAVRLWLRAQVEKSEALSLKLEGRDRDLLAGYVPGVSISAQQVIYQGIHIGCLQLSAEDIRINIGQVIRGKPLRLLKAFPVNGEVALSASDVCASMVSPLLESGLKDFWQQLIQQPGFAQEVESCYGPLPLHADLVLQDAQLKLGDDCLGLSFYPSIQDQKVERPIVLVTGVVTVEGSLLQLKSPRWVEALEQLDDPGVPIKALQSFQWDLGADTCLTHLTLRAEQLLCRGQIMVRT